MNDKPDFAVQGEKIAVAMLEAAEILLTEADNLMARTKILAEDIQTRVREHSAMLIDINRRVKGLNDAVNEAHRRFLDEK